MKDECLSVYKDVDTAKVQNDSDLDIALKYPELAGLDKDPGPSPNRQNMFFETVPEAQPTKMKVKSSFSLGEFNNGF